MADASIILPTLLETEAPAADTPANRTVRQETGAATGVMAFPVFAKVREQLRERLENQAEHYTAALEAEQKTPLENLPRFIRVGEVLAEVVPGKGNMAQLPPEALQHITEAAVALSSAQTVRPAAKDIKGWSESGGGWLHENCHYP